MIFLEKTVIILKPDAVNRALCGKLIERFEEKGLKISGLKMMRLTKELLGQHYAHHKAKPFFEELVKYMSSVPVIVIALEGNDAVAVVRKMVGVTLGREAEPGTMRGDYSMSNQNNLVHASATVEEAEIEVKRFFSANEVFDYSRADVDWIYSAAEKK